MAKSTRTDVLEILQGVVDNVKAGMVFGNPVSKDGVTILPVARISGGGGGGGGTGQQTGGQDMDGSGGGFGLIAKPAGVYVLRDGKVTWTPAVDATKVILGFQLLGMAVLLTIRALLKSRRRDRTRGGRRPE
ncbi:spore germination protein GerW family protein [Kribbella sp. NPDC026596]|uniref:spore germination protein GerW family protein n=1 Tax=Kribbella sp. NPDC026596 TaxID=3155122 RepID=UPI00340C2FD2